ncbi:MAG: hypothetical protein IT223_00645 [Crocinitomicaceae bacterium]|nr:hypothetical protein [Crocinitomicaceae bacterium]
MISQKIINRFKSINATVLVCFALLSLPVVLNAQCKPSIKIDGTIAVVDQNEKFAIQFPYWLKDGQTLAIGASVKAISVIEFTQNMTALEFSGVLNVTSASPQTVPTGKVWKIESVLTENNSSTYQSATFGVGTFSWVVPACAEQICIEAWGGGGGAGGSYSTSPYATGSGGGGGGFGSQCFSVVPGTTYAIVVGGGGNPGTNGNPGSNGSTGGTSSVGSLIYAYGGNGGVYSTSGGTGGVGGTASSPSKAQGADGTPGSPGPYSASGSGGAGGNGAAGGASVSGSGAAGLPGAIPGGGGSGGMYNTSGGKGGGGKVVITW